MIEDDRFRRILSESGWDCFFLQFEKSARNSNSCQKFVKMQIVLGSENGQKSYEKTAENRKNQKSKFIQTIKVKYHSIGHRGTQNNFRTLGQPIGPSHHFFSMGRPVQCAMCIQSYLLK